MRHYMQIETSIYSVFYWLKIKYIEKWKSNGEIIDVREFLLHKNVFSLVESKMSK